MPARARSTTIAIDGFSLTLEEVEQVALGATCALTPRARRAVLASRRTVEKAARGDLQVYGVNTGFGHLANVRIAPEHLAELQVNLIRSHAAGCGPALSREVVRAILALRANCLARGH